MYVYKQIISLVTSFFTLETIPQGVHFTSEIKEIYFRIIDFVESKKNGPRIPMNNSTVRILTMLGISKSSLFNLKKEMKTIRESRDVQLKQEEEKRLRTRSASQIFHMKNRIF